MRHLSSHHDPTRRQFIGTVLGASFALPAALPAWALNHTGTTPLRMGVIADIHNDIMHDADRRLDKFVDAMTAGEVDALLQLGDFCTPKEENRQFLSIFNRFDGPRYHVSRKYPYIQNTSPYQDSLYTTLTIDPERGRFSLSPSSTDWHGPSPKELGFEREGHVANGWVSPRISVRSMGLPTTTQP